MLLKFYFFIYEMILIIVQNAHGMEFAIYLQIRTDESKRENEICLKRLGCQQIIHQIFLEILQMIILGINYLILLK